MATQPPTESPIPSSPVEPMSPPPEISPIGPDIDQPDTTMPAGDPGTSQPAEF